MWLGKRSGEEARKGLEGLERKACTTGKDYDLLLRLCSKIWLHSGIRDVDALSHGTHAESLPHVSREQRLPATIVARITGDTEAIHATLMHTATRLHGLHKLKDQIDPGVAPHLAI